MMMPLMSPRFLSRPFALVLLLSLLSSSASNVPLENQEQEQNHRKGRRSLEDYADDEMMPVMVGYANDVGQLHLSNSAAAAGGQPETFLRNRVVSTQVRKDEIPQLQSDPNIRFVEYDGLNFADNDATSYALTTTQSISNSLTAGSNAFALGSCNDRNVIRVAVIDSGLDASHPDIGCGNNGCIGTSWGTNRAWNSPDDIHGTHVTGLITALRNGIGLQGVVPDGNVCLLVARVFGDIDDGVRTSVLAQAVEWAVDNGASVINLSISGQDPSQAFREVIDSAYRQGTVMVAAAGNSGIQQVRYPAAYDNVVAVTALDQSSRRRASFATYGNYIDFAVAGSQILSTVPRNVIRSGYGFSDGTSFSCPIVAGVMLGLRRSCRQCALPTVESCMASTASRVNDDFTGNGIVQMESAFRCLQNDNCCRGGVQAQQDTGSGCSPDTGFCRSNADCCSRRCVTSSNICLPARDTNSLRQEALARQGTNGVRGSRGNRRF